MKNLEENYKELEEINTKLDEKKKELDKLENEISELKEKYPEVSYEELAKKSDINEYVHKVIDLKQQEKQLIKIKADYARLDQEKIDLESVKNQLLKDKKEQVQNEREKIQARIKQKEELEAKKQEFVNDLNKLLSKEGILKGKDAVSLACTASSLQKCKFLSEEEKQNLKKQINEKLSKNNKSISELYIKKNESKSKATKKLEIKNKITSVIAKGKKSTIESIKTKFINSTVKVASGVKELYEGFCNSRKKSVQQKLDFVIELLNEKMSNIEKMKEEYENQNKILQQKLDILEQQFMNQNMLNETSSDQINNNEQKEESEKKANKKADLYKQQRNLWLEKGFIDMAQNQENSQSMSM